MEVLWHTLDPLCSLMRENDRIIAVETVDDAGICRCIQQCHTVGTVVVNAACQNKNIRCNRADRCNGVGSDLVPVFCGVHVCRFIQQFKGDNIAVISKAFCKFLPKRDKASLQCQIGEEFAGI